LEGASIPQSKGRKGFKGQNERTKSHHKGRTDAGMEGGKENPCSPATRRDPKRVNNDRKKTNAAAKRRNGKKTRIFKAPQKQPTQSGGTGRSGREVYLSVQLKGKKKD